MKKIFYIISFLLSLSIFSFAEEKAMNVETKMEVSENAKISFAKKFQDVKSVQWTVNDNFQRATFIKDGIKLAAFFDINGQYIATTQFVDYKKLPAISKNRLNKIYADYTIDDVVKYEIESASANASLEGRISDTIYFASLKRGAQSLLLKITSDGDILNLK